MNKLINYIEKNIDLATSAPDRWMAQNFYSQAFGALSFWSYENYEQYPNEEALMIQRWNDEWRPKFEEIIGGK
jgi:hypothetical protein